MAKAKSKEYDLIIIGAGPAGLTAGIYAARYRLSTLVIGKLPGGLISEAYKICNFPGFEEIKGIELAQKMLGQAKKLDVEIKPEEVEEARKTAEGFEITTSSGKYSSKKIIIAAGTERKKLNAKGEKDFFGRGVTYCATCDGPFYRNKTVGVVGGRDAALTSALLLSEYASKVYIIYRQAKFSKAEPAWASQVEKNSKIEPVFNSNIAEIYGKAKIEGVKLDNGKELKLDGLFIEIGSDPDEKIIKQLGLETEKGYIITNSRQETNVNGVYAAGDITNKNLKQAIVACGEGAVAANSAYEDIIKNKNGNI